MSIVYRAIALVLFFAVYIVGLIGNGLLIFIVFRQKNLRTVPNLLVVSLAMGDFLFVLFCVPFGAVAYSLEYYPFSTFYCRFENFIINLSLGVSVFSLLALSADRYKIIVKPFSSHANDPSIKLKTIVISIWLLSICLALPETLYSGLIMETQNQTNNETITFSYCWSPNDGNLLSNNKFMITRQILRLFIYYIMPLIFVSAFYTIIAKHLFQAKNGILAPLSTQSSISDVSNAKRKRFELNFKSLPLDHRYLHVCSAKDKMRPSELSNGNFKNNLSKHSITYDNEELMNMHESSPTSLPQTSSSSSSLTHNNVRRSKDLYATSAMSNTNTNTNNNNNNNSSSAMAIHVLYRDAKLRKQLRARHKVAKTVLFLCSVFFICWLPKQIHDLYWFIGVLVYSANWNHFWQFNKTLAFVLSYVYSCINPFALYFLSTTFRHFYKRYLFFWTDKSCCCFETHSNHPKKQRPRTGEMTMSDVHRISSAHNVATIYYDLNRTKSASFHQHRHSSTKGNQLKADVGQTTVNVNQLSDKNGTTLAVRAST